MSSTSPLEFTPTDHIKEIYATVSQGHSSGITKSYEWREHQLKQLGYLLQENESLLEEALRIDLGRPNLENHVGELVGTRNEVLSALKNLKKWMKPQSVKTELTWIIAKPRVSHEPKGIVAIFGAWNYPVALLFGPLVGAIAGGNSVILKPSENCPATSHLMSTLVRKYMDPQNICVINGGHEQSTVLLDCRFDHIFFTGGTSLGKIVALKAAESLTTTTLELGGKSPVVVLDDANFLVAARRILWAKGLNAGQTCIAPDYILVSEQSESKLIEAMRQVLKEFFPSDAQGRKTSAMQDSNGSSDSKFCKIINQRHFDRLNNYLSQTRGEIVKLDLNSSAQPESADPDSLRIPITLIRNVKHDDVLMEEELFGPLLPVLTYNNDHEDIVQCLHRINQSAPLALYAFGQSEEKLEFIRKHTKSGQFVCNDLLIQFNIPGLPFGGVGTSGLGNYHGYYSFLAFTYERPIVNFPFWADILLKSRYPPYTSFKFKFMQAVLGPSKLKGKSNPQPPALTDPLDFKRLLDPSSAGCLAKVPVKFSLLVLLFAFYFSRRQDSLGQKGLFNSIKKLQDQVKQFISS
ncbi:hypothetical protein PTTG_05866 [Puccinia triticina 1-1 BBBD Race 1]|uniref:Aldedh domain-containing protein n=1 Tax=Puccinia triticina (isolate 1-1 / race 1 (BBBD)) TaxID=630390 RepID=A0A180GJH7_PUCT1|nr:hypothetical protein PTTG_05866 [Puccinia triticina 1-1 BBBD Race 1]